MTAGHGVTAAGELVLLPRAIELRLADIPRAEQLSARFGLGKLPHPPLRNRTGLFVLALRPVEYTDKPIGAYPTSITGQRTVEDGDVVEATAVVLVPWQDDGAADALDARRRRRGGHHLRRRRRARLSANVLPLAMLALANNVVVWIDEAMVRRELGADRADLPGLGHALGAASRPPDPAPDAARRHPHRQRRARLFGPRAVSGAALGGADSRRHDQHRRLYPALLPTRDGGGFLDHPRGRAACPVEEALALPPIDLEAPSATLESTSILLLAPVPRNEWRAVSSRLTTRTRTLRPAAINLVATRKPLEILQQLRIPRLPLPVEPSDPPPPSGRGSRPPNLWFVRRRNLAYRDDLAGEAIRVAGRDTPDTAAPRLAALGLDVAAGRLLERATRVPRWKCRACSPARALRSRRRSPRWRWANSARPIRSTRRRCCAWPQICPRLAGRGADPGSNGRDRIRCRARPRSRPWQREASGAAPTPRRQPYAVPNCPAWPIPCCARSRSNPPSPQRRPRHRAGRRQRRAAPQTAPGEKAATTPSGKRRRRPGGGQAHRREKDQRRPQMIECIEGGGS